MMAVLGQLTGWLELTPALERTVLWTSMAFLIVTGCLLIMDLDQHKRFLYVLLRPNWTSWVAKGAYLITGFGAVLTLLLLNDHFGSGDLIWLKLVGLALALLSSVYTAFLFAQAKGRDFWQSPLLPFQMVTQSLLAGTMAVAVITGELSGAMISAAGGLLAVNILFFVAELPRPIPRRTQGWRRKLSPGGATGDSFGRRCSSPESYR